MAKFDYMNFYGGKDTEFVVHAKSFTKEQAVELFIHENITEYSKLRTPTVGDVSERRVRYFVSWPSQCNSGEFDSAGGYSYCGNDKGSFPVWVIEFNGLRITGE